ncbi:MAG TPA: hypothetical protein VHE59_14340 [Mucilaginibacter sp.]|nr:hypothetical protein [Mucilaginibacter sp.]
MQIQVDIGFDDLVRLIKKLPKDQLKELKKEIDKAGYSDSQNLESFLLQAPTFSEEQLKAIAQARKTINEWRKN